MIKNIKEVVIEVDESASCNTDEKDNACCNPISERKDVKLHWDKIYATSAHDKLGWYETDLSPAFRLIDETGLSKDARLFNVGAGSTTLIDALLDQGYSKIIASDISEVALNNLRNRVGEDKVEFIIDDLSCSSLLREIKAVDLWIDRAVLHFFTKENDQDSYFSLLKKVLKKGGYVLFAQFSLQGADKCSGLPVHRYSEEMLKDKLGDDFELVDNFNYIYTMPSGDKRPYVYGLFRRL
jgi:SAM-dependent methyltransferase